MKQVILTFGILLLVMFGFYWVSNRYSTKVEKVVISDKQIYFEIPEGVTAGTETEVKLLAKHESGKLVSYAIDFTYDSASMKVLNVEINKEIFDKKAEAKVDETLGKVILVAENNKSQDIPVGGNVVLATMKVKGVRKGGTMIYSSKRPEVGILEEGKVAEGNFQMPNFKVNFL